MSDSSYYPLTVGNTWMYKVKNGRTYTTTVTAVDGAMFTVLTTLINTKAHVRKVGDEYQTDGIEPGKWIVTFKDNLKKGDTWEASYKVNGVDTTLTYTVKEVDATKEVSGMTFKDVIFVEAESRMSMNGAPIPMNYLT